MNTRYQHGDVIQNKYCIVSILGEGGTAITYEAVDLETNNSVAIKVLSLQQTQDWKSLELFEREVKVLKNLNHPKIPKYLDYFILDIPTDKQFFLVQELVSGKSLTTLLEQGWRFQEAEVKNIAQQVLSILSYLHSFQPPIIHRDIKPQNIICTEEKEIYLVDLGAVQDAYRNTLTRGATFVGTIDYMSPEQIRGHASFASDLYSLGCTLL
ncbi:MAG: serine/threonine protein kinase [Xenococcus sp. (in: cyanobacteria)]